MPTTQELFQSAPESVSARRHRLRAERAEVARQASCVLLHDKQQLSEDEEECDDGGAQVESSVKFTVYGKEYRIPTKSIELLEVALDKRPGVPLLPSPDGIKCLVLAGFLSSRERPRPGRTEPIPRLRRQGPLGSEVLCVQCDERKIVAGTADRLIRVYDIRSGRLVEKLCGHKGSVQCLQFDEHNIVSGSWDTTVMVWDVVSFSVLHTLYGHTECVSCLRFSGNILISGSHDKSLRIWDMLSWTCVQCIAYAHKAPVTSVSFDGETCVTGSEDRTVKLWDVEEEVCTSVLDYSSQVVSTGLCGKLLVVACASGCVTIRSLESQEPLLEWIPTYDVSRAYTTGVYIDRGKVYAAGSDAVLREWDIASGACLRSLQGHIMPLTCCWAGKHRLVTAAQDQCICVWQTRLGITQELHQHGEGNVMENVYHNIPIRTITTHT